MSCMRLLLTALGLCLLASACAKKAEVKPTEKQFYKNPYVRRCLQYDKEQMASQSKACWARLLDRIQAEPGFKERAQFTESDMAKMYKMAGISAQRSTQLEEQLEACHKIPAAKRTERIGCFQDYLKRHGKELGRAKRFEIENSIAQLTAARERAAGNVEATIEHAGKLLGARLHEENEGVRIDQVQPGPMKLAKAREQGIIVAINDAKVAELGSVERIARLEACEDAPVTLLVRHGGLTDITFSRMQVGCGEPRSGKQLWEVVVPPETCSGKDSPEIKLGVSWCYLAKEGILEVEQVCADSPAAAAGVRPEHQYVSINGVSLLGKTPMQISQLFEDYPKTPVQLQERGGQLQSPSPLQAAPLNATQATKCWNAIKSVVESPGAAGNE